LQDWLAEDAGLLSVLEGVKRASRDWVANDKGHHWLTHCGERLKTAERLRERPDLAAGLEPADRDYLAACVSLQKQTKLRTRRLQYLAGALTILMSLGFAAWLNRSAVERETFRLVNFWPYTLSDAEQASLRPLQTFKECRRLCPEMVVLPAGEFLMGSARDEADSGQDEGPQRLMSIPQPFAISKFELTFDEWDACVEQGGCRAGARDWGWGRGGRPVINVTWHDAQDYVEWLSQETGQPYRLLTEAEWEYAAQGLDRGEARSEAGVGHANCDGCGSEFDAKKTAHVGSFQPNTFGLFDMQGNVWEWVEDWRTTISFPAAGKDRLLSQTKARPTKRPLCP